jgi:tRNA-intron lyase
MIIYHLFFNLKRFLHYHWESVKRVWKSLFCTQIKVEYRNGFFYSPNIYHLDRFGKGTLSRADPTWFDRHYNQQRPKGLSEQRQLTSFNPEIVDWFKDNIDREEYVLMPVEVLYLYRLGKAIVYENEHCLSRIELWEVCCHYPQFPVQFKIYEHYRRNDWIVRSGILYGCDFVLYPNTKEHQHSEYCVWIVQGPVKTLDLLSKARSIHHVKKQLLVCHVANTITSEWSLCDIGFREVKISRWVPSN